MFDNLRKVMDFDDLLFKSRNRDYGAYQLRKRYNSVVFAGIIMASLLFSAAVVLPFILTNHSDHIFSGRRGYVQIQMENFEPPIDEIIVPPSPPPPEAARVQEIVKYVPPVIVDSVPQLDTPLMITDDFISQKSGDQLEIAGTGTADDLFSGQGGGSDDAFYMVEVMPTFKGGDINKFREWVQKRTRYPQIAIDKKIKGKVFLTFIIEKDGSVSGVTVVKGVDPLIDNEAAKAITESPKWAPGLQRGQPVRVRYLIPLNFMF
jgi:periplasmic protein TonB